MDTKDIECFEAVYDTRSIHQAAKRLFITPQGLGRIIQNLEAELNTPLFERTRQGVVPTAAGRLMHEHGSRIAEQMHHLREEIELLNAGERRLRIGLANGVLRVVPLRTILSYAEQHPDVKVEWAEYDIRTLTQHLLANELDYGLVVGDSREPDLLQWKLTSVPQILLVYEGHPLYDAESVSLDQLRDEPLLTMNENFRMYHDLVRACRIKGFVPNILARTTDGGTLAQLCAQKAGLAILPEFRGGYPPGVRAIPFQEPTTWDVYAVCRQERRKDEEVREFDEYLREL